MADIEQWEYRVQTIGSLLREVKDQELNNLLNAWGQEGWEAVNAVHTSGNRVILIAKRPLSDSARRRRSWPTS